MINFEDVKKYLPQYLSDFANENLFSELKNFPENLDTRLYTNHLTEPESHSQGDCICWLPHAELPSPDIKEVNGMILSNTCDVDQSNARLLPTKLVHAPIINLNKYYSMLVELFVDTKLKPQEYIDQHIS